ncbi:MAG: methyltransferase [bacterium]|nr:MAG: methyltransferase [bacterium]
MKVLLISPPSFNAIRGDSSDIFEEESGIYPPLGLMYIAAYLKTHTDHSVEILDTQANGFTYTEIEKEIRRTSPDIVGITTLTFTLIDVINIAKMVRRIDDNIHICLGGPHVYIYPDETILFTFVDSIVLGEGEVAFAELVNALEKNTPLGEVKGITFKNGDETINTGLREFNVNLDSLPFPDRGIIPYKRYNSVLSKESLMTTMMTSRGCPFSCIYCHRPHMGKKYRARSAVNVVDEMEGCVKMGVREFMIFDDIFTLDRNRVFEVCKEIIDRRLNISWDIRSRVNTVDYEMLKQLKKAGCKRISYGIEAGTDKVLRALKKGTTLKQSEEAIKMTKNLGITTLADFMIGSPGEERGDILKTIDFALRLKPDFAQFTITTPYPATELYRFGLDNGLIKDDYWKRFAEDPDENFETPVWEETLPKEELMELLNTAYRRFYLRPGYIVRSTLKVRSFAELKRKAKAGFKVFKVSLRGSCI